MRWMLVVKSVFVAINSGSKALSAPNSSTDKCFDGGRQSHSIRILLLLQVAVLAWSYEKRIVRIITSREFAVVVVVVHFFL